MKKKGLLRGLLRVLIILFLLGVIGILLISVTAQADPCDTKTGVPFIQHDLSNSYCELCGYGYITVVVRNPYSYTFDTTLPLPYDPPIPGATMTVPRDGQGNAVTVPTVGLLMNRRLATILDVGKGDYVRMVPTKGDQRPVNLLVADIVESMFGMSVYADYNYLNRLVDEAAAVSRVQLKAQMTPAQQRDFLRAIKRYPELQTFGDTAQEEKIMEATFVTKMAGEVHPLILFGAVIFFGSILNASLIAIVERQREIATFRVLGYQRGEIGSIFLRENLLQNMLGAFLGLPLGWWLLKMQAEEFTNDMYSMPCIVSTSSWFYSIGLAFLFVIGAQFIVQRAINAMDWNEALNVKE